MAFFKRMEENEEKSNLDRSKNETFHHEYPGGKSPLPEAKPFPKPNKISNLSRSRQ
jgi:hypothetical protein